MQRPPSTLLARYQDISKSPSVDETKQFEGGRYRNFQFPVEPGKFESGYTTNPNVGLCRVNTLPLIDHPPLFLSEGPAQAYLEHAKSFFERLFFNANPEVDPQIDIILGDPLEGRNEEGGGKGFYFYDKELPLALSPTSDENKNQTPEYKRDRQLKMDRQLQAELQAQGIEIKPGEGKFTITKTEGTGASKKSISKEKECLPLLIKDFTSEGFDQGAVIKLYAAYKRNVQMVIHCSAGIGRTGLVSFGYYVFNRYSQFFNDKGEVNLSECLFALYRLRQTVRPGMIQVYAQFEAAILMAECFNFMRKKESAFEKAGQSVPADNPLLTEEEFATIKQGLKQQIDDYCVTEEELVEYTVKRTLEEMGKNKEEEKPEAEEQQGKTAEARQNTDEEGRRLQHAQEEQERKQLEHQQQQEKKNRARAHVSTGLKQEITRLKNDYHIQEIKEENPTRDGDKITAIRARIRALEALDKLVRQNDLTAVELADKLLEIKNKMKSTARYTFGLTKNSFWSVTGRQNMDKLMQAIEKTPREMAIIGLNTEIARLKSVYQGVNEFKTILAGDTKAQIVIKNRLSAMDGLVQALKGNVSIDHDAIVKRLSALLDQKDVNGNKIMVSTGRHTAGLRLGSSGYVTTARHIDKLISDIQKATRQRRPKP